jgi:hypothetical protein
MCKPFSSCICLIQETYKGEKNQSQDSGQMLLLQIQAWGNEQNVYNTKAAVSCGRWDAEYAMIGS